MLSPFFYIVSEIGHFARCLICFLSSAYSLKAAMLLLMELYQPKLNYNPDTLCHFRPLNPIVIFILLKQWWII